MAKSWNAVKEQEIPILIMVKRNLKNRIKAFFVNLFFAPLICARMKEMKKTTNINERWFRKEGCKKWNELSKKQQDWWLSQIGNPEELRYKEGWYTIMKDGCVVKVDVMV
jgi:hypothetical protein